MRIVFILLFFAFSALAQEVVDVWPKGVVPLDTKHVKVLFSTDQVKAELVEGKVQDDVVTLENGALKGCVWDTRRLAHCKMANALKPDTNYAVVVGKSRTEFRTMGLQLNDYREYLQDGKFRLHLAFSQAVSAKGLKLAVRCAQGAWQSYVGDMNQKGDFSLPVSAPARDVCYFKFPEGVRDSEGHIRLVQGEWLLRGHLPGPSEEEMYYMALRGLSCGMHSHWQPADELKKGISMPQMTCPQGETIRFTVGDHQKKNISISTGNGSAKFDQWGSATLDLPKTGASNLTINVRDPLKPHLSNGYRVRIVPAMLLEKTYAELVDDGSYFEATKPFLTQINHRATPLVEVSAINLRDDEEILAALKGEEYYVQRRKPREKMPEGKTFQLASLGSEGFKSGLDLNQLDEFSPGIWWVQSTILAPSLAVDTSRPEGNKVDRSSAAILQFSDLGIHIKRGLKGSLVWVFRLSNGKPVADADVSIGYGEKIERFGETKADGTLVIPEDKVVSANSIVIARKDDDVVALPLNYMTQSGITYWDYGHTMVEAGDLEWQYDAIPSNPLYRPGEKGALKIYARKSGLKGPELSEHKGVAYDITNPLGEKISEGKIDFNEFGTAVVEFNLKPEATTGKYQLNIEKRFVMEPFSVEVFTTPTLKVTMDALSSTRSPLSVNGAVEFHVGGGVQNSKGEAALVVRTRAFAPTSTSPYSIFNFYDARTSEGAELVGKQEFTTDKEGRFSVRFDKLQLPEFGTLIAEATVTDGDGMTVSGRTEIPVSKRGWFPGSRLDGYVFDEGEAIRPKLIVLASDGQPLAGVKARYQLTRQTWNTVRRLGSGNVYYYDSVLKKEPMGSCEVTSASTVVDCALTPKGEGNYLVTITTSFQGQQGPEREESFWVPGPNSWAWGPRNNHDRIDIKPEKTSYEYGEKARFIVHSPYKEGQALVTVERYGVIRHEVVNFSGGFWTYELDLNDTAYVPGVYLSVVLLKGRTSEKLEGGVDLGRPSFKMGYAQINVSQKPTILKVEASTKPRFSPGEEVEVSLNVKDWNGGKVNGELAVTVVDDAVLQLVPSYKSFFEVLDTFYHIKGLGVWNHQTLTRLIGRRSFGKKGAVAGGGGGNGLDDLRSNFKTVAHWEPMLAIKDGKAKFKFKLPDNLTSWRVIAVAVDGQSRFGEGETTFKAVLPLMLTPFFPPFLRQGDSFTGAFGVQNATEKNIDVDLNASMVGLTPNKVGQKKAVGPGIRELLNFPFTTNKSGPVSIEARATGAGHKDGARIELPIWPDEGARHVSGAMMPLSGTQSLDFTMPIAALPNSTRVKVYFTKSLLDGLDEAFRYVVHYPYGCWEQQTTGALFLTEYKEMEPWLAEFKFDEKKGDARSVIQAYINKAPEYQRNDGTMAYYPGSDWADPYLTVYTGHAFGVFKKAGFTLPKVAESRLRARLIAMKDHAGDMGRFTDFKPSMNAFIATILHDLDDPEGARLASKLYAQRQKMDLFGQGMLLKALPQDSSEAKALVAELMKKSVTRDTTIVFSEKMPSNAKNWLYSERRGQCVVVDALLRHGTNEVVAAKMIQGLAPDRKTARWGNTQENYFCFQAFRTYAREFETTESRAEIAWTMGKDKQDIDVKRLQRPFVEYSESDLKMTTKARAELKSGGKAYLHTRMFWSTKAMDAKATGNGFTLEKTVLLKSGTAWNKLQGPLWTMKKGDLVKVILKVTGTAERYKVGLNDPIPAGWRALNPRLATTSVAQQVAAGTEEANGAKNEEWWDWENPAGFSASDMRVGKVQFFADHLTGGKTYEVEYLAQVTTVGEFQLPPTVVEEMYDEEWRATTAGVKVRVVD